MKKLLILAAVLLFSTQTFARSFYSNYAQQGGYRVSTFNFQSLTQVQRSFPGCTVSVHTIGTTTLVPLFTDIIGTAKPNPFTAGSEGSFSFWTDSAGFDITFSGKGLTTNCGSSGQLPCNGAFTWTNQGLVDTNTNSIAVSSFGALCDGVTDDTVAIQAAIDVVGPHQVIFPASVCKTTTTLTVAQNRVWLIGQGKQSSRIHFVPTVTGLPAIHFINGVTTIVQCGIYGLTVYTDSAAGIQKIGIRWTDASELTISQVAMYPFTSNSNSIGLQSRGREFIYIDHVEISADQPVSIEPNPNATISLDHAHWSDLYLLPQSNLPAIKFASGPMSITNFITSGSNACVGGSDCISSLDSADTVTHSNIVIAGWRWEQPSSAGYFFNWARNTTARAVRIQSNQFGATTTMKGIRLRNMAAVTFASNMYTGTTTVIDVDSTVYNLHLDNSFLLGGSSTSMSGQKAIFKVNKVADSTSPDFASAWYDSTGNTNITLSGILVNLGGLNEYAAANVSVLTGASNRVTIPLGGGGQIAGYVEVACRGTTLTVGGTAAVSTLGATKLTTGDTNFDVGNVGGKLTVFWEAANIISLMNQTAEDMTCGYRHWWF